MSNNGNNDLTDVELKQLSQLVYLDIAEHQGKMLEINNLYKANKGKITVGELVEYYQSPEGNEILRNRYTKELNGKPEYDQWMSLLETMNKPEYRNWEISNVVSHNGKEESGFVAFTVDTKDGNKIAAFRGSEPMENSLYRNDWKNNATTSYSLEAVQQEEARRYINSLKLKEGEQLYLTGHSLGGNLALYSSFILPESMRDQLVSATTFNAPGFNANVLNLHEDAIQEMNRKGQLREFRNIYDIVPALFNNPSKGIYVDSLSTGAVSFDHHSLFSLKVDEKDATTFQRSDVQVSGPVPDIVHNITVGLDVVPAGIKMMIVQGVFAIWDTVESNTLVENILLAGVIVAAGLFFLGPIGLGILAVKILVGTIAAVIGLYVIGFIINKLIPWIEQGLQNLAELVENFFKEAVEVITNLVVQACNLANLIGDQIVEFTQKVKGAVTQFFKDLKDGFNRFVDDTIQYVKAQTEKLKKLKDQAVQKLGDIFNAVKDTFSRKKTEVIESVRSFKDSIVGNLKAKVKQVAKFAAATATALHQAKIAADLSRLQALQQNLRRKQEDIASLVRKAVNAASSVASMVGRSYPEPYVQARLRELERLAEEVQAQERKVSEKLEQQSNGVKHSVDTYRSTESKLKAMSRSGTAFA